MIQTRVSRLACALAVSILAPACGDSTGPQPALLTVDEVLADLQEVQEVAAAATTFGGVSFASHALPNASACAYSASTQTFVCPPATATGVTFSRSFQLFDAGGTLQSAFNPSTTDAIRTISDASGTVTSQNGAVTFAAHEDHTVSGLLAGVFTLNGTATSNSTLTMGDVTLTAASNTTTADVVFPQRGSSSRYPQSGSIATELAITNGSSTANVEMTLTFNGTSVVTMVMTTSGTTLTCAIDMSHTSKMPNCS